MRIGRKMRLILVLGIAIAAGGCSYDEYVKVQNQLDETVDFSWWDVAPDQGTVVTVRIPPRSTVRFHSGSFNRKDGTGFIGVPRTCGLSYRTIETGREVTKRDALAGFAGSPWIDTHKLGEGDQQRTLFFVLTQNDIVVVLTPRKMQDIETITRETKPIIEKPQESRDK